MFDENNFLNLLASGEFGSTSLFFINPQSVLGKNKVLNFLGTIGFEISTLGFSNKANEIAEFYDNLKQEKGAVGIKEFCDNEVIQSILTEMKSMPTVQRYLNERIFDLVKQDMVSTLNALFNDSEKILKKNKEKEKKQENKKEKNKNKKSKQSDFQLATYVDNTQFKPINLEELFDTLKKIEQEEMTEKRSENVELDDTDEQGDDNEFYNL